MKYFSMFSGIGGFEYGIHRAVERIEIAKKDNSPEDCALPQGCVQEGRYGASCIGFSEVDKYATKIYKKHFNHKEYGDAKNIKWQTVEDFDLLCGGFPCQAFSLAGKRKGFNDTRGTLFFEIARCLREKRPRLLLLENVKGLLSHDKGRTFGVILNTLDEIGYDLQWQVLNSKDFGVPQNRERVFIVGHLRGTNRPQVFPIRENEGLYNEKDQTIGGQPQTEITGTVRRNPGKADDTYIIHNVYGGFKEKGVRKFKDHSPTIRTPKGGGHIPMVTSVSPLEYKWGETCGALRARDYKDPKAVADGYKIRRLTPTECERLQGFPDLWTTEGWEEYEIHDGFWGGRKVEISDTQRYKCLGNAVTTNVITAIMEKLI